MSFTFLDILLIIILSQGIFLTLAIQLVPNKNKAANSILTCLLIIASIMLFGRIALYRMPFDELLRIATLIDTTLFLFGPLLFCYIRRLAFQEKKTYQLPLVHFVPAFIYAGYFLWTFTMDTNEFNTSYNNGSLNLAFILIEQFGLLSISFYTYKSYALYVQFKRNQKYQIAFNQSITSYVKFLIMALTTFVLLWAFSFVSFYGFGKFNPYLNYNTMWLSTSIFMYFIGFYSLTQPQIFRVSLKNDIEKQQTKSRIKPEDIKELEVKLKQLIETEKIFLIPDLNLRQLAKSANTSSNNLSWYLNQVLNKNFYEYINGHRIDEFLRLVKVGESESKTLLAIALESGFNTKSTFNSSFKTIMNDTPNNYIKTHLDVSKRTHPVD
ncbi:helix-turn-helix domain-containing protein [Winogradskyella maritima]|uniref:Helix-turn-helix domain-containing protein n=1 Tax=Winogradskyella maritima TaxID=1517766 RepID=A0ABV8AGT6_9FLAO|nr:helix-turn-helix domain-containing protein [Winogradskyella maritima]